MKRLSFPVSLVVCCLSLVALTAHAASCPTSPTVPLSGSAVATTGVNVRSAGCSTGNIVYVLSKGETVTLIGQNGSWDKVKTSNGATGWSADWLLQNVPTPVVSKPTASTTNSSAPSAPLAPSASSASSTIHVSADQSSPVPSTIDMVALNQYWLSKINALRAAKNLRLLVLAQPLVDTSATWAGSMAANQYATHTRPNGETVNQWAIDQGLQFTTRYSPGGWVTNFFTENISWRTTNGTMASVESALDATLASFVAEGPTGAHYQTVYFPDWNSVGTGIGFVKDGSGYDIYAAFHYASLAGVTTP